MFYTKPAETPAEKQPQKEDNDPPCVTFPAQPIRRSYSANFYFKKEVRKSVDYQLKNPNAGRVLTKSISETKEDRGALIKQDSKGDRRDWLKKQLSVNHHYLKDLKMPLNSIGHRNAMLNINRYRLKASSCPDIFKNSMVTINDDEEVTITLLDIFLSLSYNEE